jgi:methyl-accepting chemotaxis protein
VEHGLGFAVVADEVRVLARRCAAAAEDTDTIMLEAKASATEGARGPTRSRRPSSTF